MMSTSDCGPSPPDALSRHVSGVAEIDQEVTTTTGELIAVSARLIISKTGQFPRGRQPRTPSHRPVRTVTNP